MRSLRHAIMLVFTLLVLTELHAEVEWNITIEDPEGAYASFHELIQTGVTAAGREWSRFLIGDTVVDIAIRFDSQIFPFDAYAINPSSEIVGTLPGGMNIYNFTVPQRVITGTDRNGSLADGSITIRPDWLRDLAWFDPDPVGRSGTLPANKADFQSLMIHEIGHLLGFMGWQDYNGSQSSPFKSPFDLHVIETNGNYYFVGTAAAETYGRPVPLTFGNGTHIGNPEPRPGSGLLADVMYAHYTYGARRFISSLDLAILADTGLKIRSLIPATLSITTDRQTTFTTEIGRTYGIETSIDLTQWTPLESIKSTNSVMRITDSAAGIQRRFYRVFNP